MTRHTHTPVQQEAQWSSYDRNVEWQLPVLVWVCASCGESLYAVPEEASDGQR
jgi:hypothetical protein